jgi:hypothetical protein
MAFKIDTSDYLNELEIEQVLCDMEEDQLLNTGPILTRSVDDSVIRISFRDKHTVYLKNHPKVSPQDYLANVKTMIRIRV